VRQDPEEKTQQLKLLTKEMNYLRMDSKIRMVNKSPTTAETKDMVDRPSEGRHTKHSKNRADTDT
jgi:hypothetical protein